MKRNVDDFQNSFTNKCSMKFCMYSSYMFSSHVKCDKSMMAVVAGYDDYDNDDDTL